MHRPVSTRHLFPSSRLVSSRSCTCYSRNGLKFPIPLLFLYRSSCQAPPHTHIDKYISFFEYYTPKFANYQFILIFCEYNMLFAEQRMCLGTSSRSGFYFTGKQFPVKQKRPGYCRDACPTYHISLIRMLLLSHKCCLHLSHIS